MAIKYVDETKLNAAMAYEAGKIREKLGSSAQLDYDFENGKGFGDYVEAIPSGGGIIKAEGDFTILAESKDNAPTLTHNLGTQKIAVLIYPTSKITATAGYHNFFAEVMNINALCDNQTWTFDWTSYNTHFSTDEIVNLPNANLRIGAIHCSPWTTQSSWNAGGNPPVIQNGVQNNAYRVVYTDNTVRVRGAGVNFIWAVGSYHWIVWKLG